MRDASSVQPVPAPALAGTARAARARIPVAILGATGVVGQRFAARLAHHPLFELVALTASERSQGKTYAEACNWRLPASAGPAYAGLAERVLQESAPLAGGARIAFSALDATTAREIEPAWAQAGALVFSNASAFRLEPDVPLLVPEVNPEHLRLLEVQRKRRGWSGGIVCNPNCTATVLVMPLAPLQLAFGIEAVSITSLQAVSGAGYPGVASLDILGNSVPYIPGEEDKLEHEIAKMLGTLEGESVRPAPCLVSASCNRVAVIDGHAESVALRLRGAPALEAVREALASWHPRPQQLRLHSAPERALRLHERPDRPQARLDVEADGGMSVHVGRLRPCNVLGIKMALLGHNAERGAAGGSLLNAELAHAEGWLA